jgi:hypothetical protein
MARRKEGSLTRAIASEAARLLAEGHCHDSHSACRKAAERLGEGNSKHWPDAAAIEAALHEYQSLFQRDSQPAALEQLRQLALQAMRDLAGFEPRLVGPVAKGLADRHSPIRLLLRADTPEQVALALEDRRIPWRSAEVELLFSRNRRSPRPAFRFQAGDTTVELVVLDPADRQDPPRDPADDSPLRGLSASALHELLTAG